MTNPDHDRGIAPRFESLVGQSGVYVHDPIEDVQAILFTNRSVDPTPASTDGFVYPVDSAAAVTVTRLRTTLPINFWIRNIAGDLVEAFEPNQPSTVVPTGEYLLEFGAVGMKMYGHVRDSKIQLTSDSDGVSISFDPDTTVRLGARSLHSQPADTLTVTGTPRGLMDALSMFGTAMKTWSAERTFPSLRGHPPLVEIGDSTEFPDHLSVPQTDIRVTVPAEHRWVYPVAPLAYWLGATVEPGEPTLHVGKRGYPLGSSDAYTDDCARVRFENHVRDVLQFSFLFDCAVRTEGFYNVELDPRRRIERAGLPLDFERLYDTSLVDRLQTYLELDESFEELSELVGRPGWRLTTDVQATADRATILPFLARDLSVVRCPSTSAIEQAIEEADGGLANAITRSTPRGAPFVSDGGVTKRASSPEPSQRCSGPNRILKLPEAESMSQAWVGEGFAVGAAKASTSSYLQRLETYSKGASQISIDVIVNDDEMVEEADVSNIYGTRDHLDFVIDIHQNVTTTELAEIFEHETDFVHYIGHVDPEGFECIDGHLDAEDLDVVGASTFVLNACASYKQGQHLVDKGAIAGVVTLEDVISSMATKIGKSIARLLNYGFPVGSATNLIQETMFSGSNYAVVGDTNATLAQSNIPVPNVVRVELVDEGSFELSMEAFGSWNYDIGTMYRPFIPGCDMHYIVPGKLDTWVVDTDVLDEFLDTSTFPLIGVSNLYWSDEVSGDGLRDVLLEYN